jgi:ABC-2 type transport system permease protein
MKQLILFSLKRRFLNPVAISLQVLFTVIMIVLFNFDRLSTRFKLDFVAPTAIQVSQETLDYLLPVEYWEKQGLTLSSDSQAIAITYQEGLYLVEGKVSINLQIKIYNLLLQSHQQRLLNESHPSVAEFVMIYNTAPVRFEQSLDPMASLRENLIFMILTSVYFMMLNFISVNSNEIIQEKTSNVLEFILTSVTPFQHFCAKILTGLITVMVQIGLSLGIFTVLLIQRLRYDQGKGLLDLANKLFNLEANGISLESLSMLLKFDSSTLGKAILSFMFLIIGVLIIQVLILVLSARVKTIEEAGSIQGPFYLGLLVLYYSSLMLNTPDQLTQGLGRVLSTIPVSSMLVMGMRILNTEVSLTEIGFSLLMSILALVVIMGSGLRWYQKGLVNE